MVSQKPKLIQQNISITIQTLTEVPGINSGLLKDDLLPKGALKEIKLILNSKEVIKMGQIIILSKKI